MDNENIETLVGKGPGPIVSRAEGLALLLAHAKRVPLSTWAGELATESEITESLSIPMAVLLEWIETGIVICLNEGKKRQIPKEQFVDGLPAPGIYEVRALCRFNDRAAWNWLIIPHHSLGNTPISELKKQNTADVLSAASWTFSE